MFHIIEPQQHPFYQSNITYFVKDLQNATIIDQEHDLTKATFLLVTEEAEEVSGGVLLLKQGIEMIPPEIRENLYTYCPNLQEIWTGAIAFRMNETLIGRTFEKSCKALYRILYEDLIVFSIKENAPLLCLTMPLIEHLSIELLGLWSWLLEVRSPTSDELFHKVLQLPGIQKEIGTMCKYDKTREESRDLSLPPAKNCDAMDTL